jgi:hypothetical protein
MFFQGVLGRHGNRRDLPPTKPQGLTQKEPHLRLLTTDAGELLDAVTSLRSDLGGPLAELFFERLAVWGEGVDATFLMKLPHGFEPTFGKDVQHSLRRPSRRTRQFSNPLVSFAMLLQPQDLHPPLDAGIGMVKAFFGDDTTFFVRELKSAHPCVSQKNRVALQHCTDCYLQRPFPPTSICASIRRARYIQWYRALSREWDSTKELVDWKKVERIANGDQA